MKALVAVAAGFTCSCPAPELLANRAAVICRNSPSGDWERFLAGAPRHEDFHLIEVDDFNLRPALRPVRRACACGVSLTGLVSHRTLLTGFGRPT